MGESVIFDDEGNLRTVDSWAANEIIRLRGLIPGGNMSQVNDAVLVPWGGSHLIKRVIAITEDGRRIVEPVNGHLEVESTPGSWAVVGYYIEISGWFDWLFDTTDYKFIPNGVVTCPRSEHTETASK